ncbi:MAG: molybdopterin-dependent oxidoreductase [Hyphomicrobiales bacterium]|nr:molybdopterin-dependent oxidoreductase [Hyphomicrobiales bacterium]
MTRNRLAVAIVMALSLIAAPLGTAAAGDDATLLTVIGNVAKPNRPALNPFRDAFFKFGNHEFDRAHAFDRATLAALPQVEIRAKAASWPAAVAARGPLLKDVLESAGVSETATVTVYALDGYGAELSAAERAAKDWVLAIEMDGTPLGLGGRGPAWLLHDTGDGEISADAEAKWVWSAFLIAAE